MLLRVFIPLLTILFFTPTLNAQQLISVAEGWANNSINTTVFRKNSLVTHKNVQFIAFYDPEGCLILGKRDLTEKDWTLHKTQYKGNTWDAHNSISIMVDGNGFLHVSWDHHGHPLRYAQGLEAYGLELSDKRPMTGLLESNVTYPEFFRMPDGNLIFMYRDGQSGKGNLVINKYDTKSRLWTQLHQNLIDGEGQRNAYWQACVDYRGVIHVSWVWRETPDVSTNHNLCYARSTDGGKNWTNSKGKKYTLPIIKSTAETACHIPQNSELINQTSMCTDQEGNPFIATYWREEGSDIPQYHIVYHDGKIWQKQDLGFRQTPFSLKGSGTKRIPISRPQLLVKGKKKNTKTYLIFRDEERGEKVSLASCNNLQNAEWYITDLTDFSVGAWEPSYDTELWKEKQILHIFVQKTEQADGEGRTNTEPQKVWVLKADL